MRGLLTLLREEWAAAAAELALILPAVLFIFINVADLSMYVYSKMQVDLAAQEAVGIARVMCDEEEELPATENCGGLDDAMLGAAQATSLGDGVSLGTPNAAWYCSNGAAELVEVASISAPPPDDCSGVIGTSTSKPGEYISVTASYSFTPIFPYASVATVLPATISREAWMRLQ